MTMYRVRHLLTITLAFVAVALVGCESGQSRVERIALGWLTELSDPDDEDRGWSSLHPRAQERFEGGVTEYLELLNESGLSSLEWSVSLPTSRHDDFYTVHVAFAGGEAQVPEFLVERLLIQFPPGAPDDEGVITVYLDLLDAGVVAP